MSALLLTTNHTSFSSLASTASPLGHKFSLSNVTFSVEWSPLLLLDSVYYLAWLAFIDVQDLGLDLAFFPSGDCISSSILCLEHQWCSITATIWGENLMPCIVCFVCIIINPSDNTPGLYIICPFATEGLILSSTFLLFANFCQFSHLLSKQQCISSICRPWKFNLL